MEGSISRDKNNDDENIENLKALVRDPLQHFDKRRASNANALPSTWQEATSDGIGRLNELIPVTNWRDNLALRRKPEGTLPWPFQKSLQAKNRWNVRPAGALGVGCGAGLGVGLIGGAGFGPEPWKLFKFVFGLGVGCGVGIGYGFGLGLGVRWDQPPHPPEPESYLIKL